MNEIIELSYGAQIQPDGTGYLVTFRDIENAFTYGETLSVPFCAQNICKIRNLLLKKSYRTEGHYILSRVMMAKFEQSRDKE